MTREFYSTKYVFAWPQQNCGEPGMAIRYQDGHQSWCPQATFERDYQPTTAMSFGHAIHALKAGKRVARAGWNGKGMFLFLVPGSKFKVSRPPLLGIYEEGTEISYHGHVDLKAADGQVLPWNASQADMLADDWMILDEA